MDVPEFCITRTDLDVWLYIKKQTHTHTHTHTRLLPPRRDPSGASLKRESQEPPAKPADQVSSGVFGSMSFLVQDPKESGSGSQAK